MAKREEKNDFQGSGQAGAAVAERKKKPVSEATASAGNEGRSSKDRTETAPKRGFFDIYKSGQGYHTRIWSGVGYGALVFWFAWFLYDKFSLVDAGKYTQVVQVSVFATVIAIFGLVGYWLLGLNKKVGDFLIATEGEMKKVNWTSRKDIIGSTKVVIFLLVAMTVMLFVVDIFFMSFFNAIGVLKGAALIDAIKELF
ncbi:MAG: preprotein translocase subunit SecE [Phycisphaerales bacterium]|nr:preprotein translocase subunit SecE [Phycisphaerales bacterium]